MNEFKPMTTTEAILGKIAGIYNGEMPKAYTRLHLILQKIAENPGDTSFDKSELEAIKILTEDAVNRISILESQSSEALEITTEDIDELF